MTDDDDDDDITTQLWRTTAIVFIRFKTEENPVRVVPRDVLLRFARMRNVYHAHDITQAVVRGEKQYYISNLKWSVWSNGVADKILVRRSLPSNLHHKRENKKKLYLITFFPRLRDGTRVIFLVFRFLYICSCLCTLYTRFPAHCCEYRNNFFPKHFQHILVYVIFI